MMEYTTIRKRSFRLDKSLVTINGKRLSDYGVFLQMEGFSIGGASPQTLFQDVPGRFSVDTTLRDGNGNPAYDRREITLSVGMVGDPTEIDEAMTLIGALNGLTVTVGGLHSKGEFRGVMTVGDWETMEDSLGERRWAGTTLTLNAEPFVYGVRRTIRLTAGDNRFLVEGTSPVTPTFTFPTVTAKSMALDAIAWIRAYWPDKFAAAGWDAMSDEDFLNDVVNDECPMTNDTEWKAKAQSDPVFARYSATLENWWFNWDQHEEIIEDIRVQDSSDASLYLSTKLTLDGDENPQTVVMDCANRTVTVNGNLSACTLDSSWLQLKPGRFGLTSSVSGTLTYTPVYLI